MPFCTTCGKQTDAKFCPDDGTKIGAAAGSTSSSSTTTAVKAGGGLSTNKGDDWLPSAFKTGSGYGGSEAETEQVLGEMLNETNRVFGQLGVTVSAQRKPPTAAATTACGGCNKPITGPAVQALGKVLHPQCLTCHKCFAVIGGESFVVRGVNKDQAWCDACVQREKSAGKPAGALSPSQAGVPPFRPAGAAAGTGAASSTSSSGLTSSQRSEFLNRRDEGKTYCLGCGDVMMGDGVVSSEGVWHEHCFKCAGCKLPIKADTAFSERGGKPYHPGCTPNSTGSSTICTGCGQALVGKFVRTSDGKPWHKECFTCVTCKKDLTAGYTIRDAKPYCGTCASAATPYITTTTAVSANKDMGGIRYNQVTREVTRVAAPNFVTSPVKNPGQSSVASTPVAAPSGPVVAGGGGNKFCQQCGATLNGMKFCGGCGAKA